MTALIVILIILVVFWLIGLIRLGGRIRFGEAGFFVTVLAGPVKIQVFPMVPKRPKKEKPKKEKKPKKAKHKLEKPKPEGQPGTLTRLLSLMPTVIEAVRTLRRKIRIDDFDMTLIWGGSDPASIAIGYGQANAAVGMISPLMENNFIVKRREFHIDMDYGRTEPAVELTAAFTITIGQIVSLTVWYGLKLLILWIRSGRPAKK